MHSKTQFCSCYYQLLTHERIFYLKRYLICLLTAFLDGKTQSDFISP